MVSTILEKKYSRNEVEQYVIDILSLDLCMDFFPLSVRNVGDDVILACDTEGYVRLSEIHSIDIYFLIKLLIKIDSLIKRNENNFISLSKYKLSEEYIYIDEFNKKIKLVYFPDSVLKSRLGILGEIAAACESKIYENVEFYYRIADILRKKEGGTNGVLRDLYKLEEIIVKELDFQ